MKKCSDLNQERNLHRSSSVYKTNTVQNIRFFDVRDNRRCTFFTRKRYYGLWTQCIWVKNVLMLDLFQLLSSPDVNWWTGVVWIIVMFLSAVWTLILTAPIHCRGSIAETFLQIWWRNKLILIWDDLQVSTFTEVFSFLVNCSFNALMHCWLLLSTYLRFMWLRQYLTCFTAVLMQHACGFKCEYLVGVQQSIKELFQACFRFIFASVWQYVMDAGGCLH